MAEKTCTREHVVKVNRREDQITQTYNIEYENVEWNPDRICRIVYEQNIIGDERLEMVFSGPPNEKAKHGEITRYGDKINIRPKFSCNSPLNHLSTDERLKSINPEIMEKILNQLSPEAKSFLEKILEI